MAVYDQLVTTYDDTTPQVRVISDAIFLIDPVDVPFIDAVGGLDAARDKFEIRQNGKKIEILEDEHAPLSGSINGTEWTSSTTSTTVTVADASVFQDGHVILVDNEYMVVKSVNLSAETIEVYARDYGGTNATHANGAAIEIVGMARLEGDDADYGPIVDITAPFNFTAIYQEGIKVSGTEQAIEQYGMSDKFSYEAMKMIPGKTRLIEKMAFHGIRDAGAEGSPRSAGGLGTFITDNTVGAGGAVTKTDFDDLSEAIMSDGGMPDILVCSIGVARDLRDLVDTSSFVRLDLSNNRVGMAPTVQVVTQYHNLRVVASRFAPDAIAWALQSNKVGYYTLRPWQEHRLAKTGDSMKGEVLWEGSLLVANDKAHGKITGITT